MKWLAEIQLDSNPYGIAEEVLKRAGYSILQQNVNSGHSVVIHHPEFERSCSANEVHFRLETLADRISVCSRFLGAPFSITDIVIRELKPDGTYKNYFYGKISCQTTSSLSFTEHYDPGPNYDPEKYRAALLEQHRREEEANKERLISLLAASLSNPNILNVLSLMKMDDPSATDLGHIVDLIQDECNGDIGEFTTKAKQRRFERSINHPEIMGLKARHAVSREQPPPKPMSFEEAKEFAHRVGAAWLDRIEKYE